MIGFLDQSSAATEQYNRLVAHCSMLNSSLLVRTRGWHFRDTATSWEFSGVYWGKKSHISEYKQMIQQYINGLYIERMNDLGDT